MNRFTQAILLLMFLLIWFVPLLSMVVETVDILLMLPSTQGTVLKSSFVPTSDSYNSGWPLIHYQYTVDGTRYESDRLLPGFAGNGLFVWSQADVCDIQRQPGDEVMVHYCPFRPQHACFEYGWHKFSVTASCITWGGILAVLLWNRYAESRAMFAGVVLATSLVLFGGRGLLFGPAVFGFGRCVFRCSELHWLALIWLACCSIALAGHGARWWVNLPRHTGGHQSRGNCVRRTQ
jgi:hypothetical protein